jgi:hypothetical protein
MPEIVDDPPLLSCYHLFLGLEIKNIKDLVLISSRLAGLSSVRARIRAPLSVVNQ